MSPVGSRSCGEPCLLAPRSPGLPGGRGAGRTALGSAETSESAAGSVTVRGLLVQQMAPSGVELLVGTRHDRLFGPAVIVGLGGVFAEILDDVAIGLAPLATEQGMAMLDQ